MLTDAQWALIDPQCLGKSMDLGRSGRDNRLFMKTVLWIVRTGSPWHDLPAVFGNWSTAFRRFSDWRNANVFERISDALSGYPDMEYEPLRDWRRSPLLSVNVTNSIFRSPP